MPLNSKGGGLNLSMLSICFCLGEMSVFAFYLTFITMAKFSRQHILEFCFLFFQNKTDISCRLSPEKENKTE